MTEGEPERSRARRGDGDRLRGEVLEAVNRLLDRWGGYEKLTMRAVAREVGVSAPSLYLHFADKADLVWAALSDKYVQLAEQMAAADAAADPADARDRLRAEVHAYCRFALESPGQYRLMYEVGQPAVSMDRVGHHPSRVVGARFRAGVARCAVAGAGLALPPWQAAYTLWAGLHGIVSLQHGLSLSGAADSAHPLADGLLDTLLGPRPGESAVVSGDTEVERLIARTVTDQLPDLPVDGLGD